MTIACGEKICGLIAGTRKAGTTWLYENFLKDPNFIVSSKVKESGFFAGTRRLDVESYHQLFDTRNCGVPVEVDASVCYQDVAPTLITRYNPEMRVVLVLRDPGEYMISRYVHSFRKGEIKESHFEESFRKHHWLQAELDYGKIIDRFSYFEGRHNLCLVSFAFLRDRPIQFYRKVAQALYGDIPREPYHPITEPVNQARVSTSRFLTSFLSTVAILARKYNLDGIVNAAKRFGLHTKLERNVSRDVMRQKAQECRSLVASMFPRTIEIYNEIEKDSY